MDIETLRAGATAFHRLHLDPTILILPNAWDVASAVILAEAGFPAIATTSAGIAFSRGHPDGERISRDAMLAEVARITARLDIPVTADIEAGYGPTQEEVAESDRRATAAGAVAAHIEDGSKSSTASDGTHIMYLNFPDKRATKS